MNIFFLDTDPQKAAQMMCDKHVCKMILESCQMLTNPYYYQHGIHKMKEINESNQSLVDSAWSNFPRETPYRIAFPGHPCSVWVASSFTNWNWLLSHAIELCNEFAKRYGKPHSCLEKLTWMQNNKPSMQDIGFTPPAQAMPHQYKNENPVLAYQAYYINEKAGFAKWKLGNVPEFWERAFAK